MQKQKTEKLKFQLRTKEKILTLPCTGSRGPESLPPMMSHIPLPCRQRSRGKYLKPRKEKVFGPSVTQATDQSVKKVRKQLKLTVYSARQPVTT